MPRRQISVFPTNKFINFYVDKLFHLIYCPLNDAITLLLTVLVGNAVVVVVVVVDVAGADTSLISPYNLMKLSAKWKEKITPEPAPNDQNDTKWRRCTGGGNGSCSDGRATAVMCII